MNPETHFKCAICGEIFELDPDFTGEGELVEAIENFGTAVLSEPLVRICDPCYQLINPILIAEARQKIRDKQKN